MYLDGALRMQRRAMASQARATALGIAQAFGQDISGVMKELDA